MRFTPGVALALSVVLAWTMLVVAALSRTRAATAKGIVDAFGNREALPEPTAFAARADRAARNMSENLILFCALLLAASWARVPENALAVPCAIFVAARFGYALLYWAGVKYVRTIAWVASLVGLSMLVHRALLGLLR